MTNDFKARKNGYRQPQRSPEEYKQFKKEEKEAVYQLVDSAVANVVSSPTEFHKFLDTQAHMDRYSAANALLIYKQCPEATQLKDFDGWREENVRIKKGAKSISILEPVDYTRANGTQGISYNVKKVFDVSQTNGRRKPAPTVNRDPRNLVTVMINTSPVNCESAEQLPNPDAVAYYDNSKDTLFIKKGVGDSVALFQAVCVGYMLCKKYGVDTKSFAVDRVPAEWKDKEPNDVRAELSKVRTAMSDIHSRISDELYRQQQERTADRAR